MFRHSSYRLTTINQSILAIVMGLGFSTPAYAIQLGQASVQSEQHEPLSATIPVSNIDANSFSASIAPAAMYSQLGLNPSANVSVQFQKTSDTSGTLLIHSSTPVSTPFADIVLNLNNDGEQYIEPQTLLMPLPKSGNMLSDSRPVTIVPESSVSNLPTVSNTPIIVSEDPLNTYSSDSFTSTNPQFINETNHHSNNAIADDTNWSYTDNTTSQNTAPLMAGQIVSEEERILSSLVPEGTNTQMNILTKQLTRRVLSSNDLNDTNLTPFATPTVTESNISATEPTTEYSEIPSFIDTQTDEAKTDTTATYVVQKGDNLWSIAYQIAQANDMNVQDVMTTLHTQNPNAFFNNQASQLKVNATLTIPNYRVVLSQKAIEEAISARKQQSNKINKSQSARSANTVAQTTVANKKSDAQSVKRPLPTPQVSLVTQAQSGQAVGSQTKTTTGTKGLGQGELVDSLKDVRTQTVQRAKRVNTLNQELSSATQKLQLQNQRLAELEARLKSLKDK